MRKIVCLCLFILVVLGLFGCSSTPGIDNPITIDGNELQVVSASLHNTYMIGSQEYSPKSTGDLLLLVRASVSGSDDVDLGDWKAQVQDATGRLSTSDIQSKITGTVEGQEGTFLEWFFVVDRFAQELTLHLRDYEIDLSSLLETPAED